MSLLNKIDHISVSSIQKWIDCPRSWWVKYVLGLDTPSSEAASFGSQYDQLISKKLGFETEPMKQPLVDGVEDAVAGYFSQPYAMKDATGAQGKVFITPDQWAVHGEILGLSVEIFKPILGYIDLENRLRGILTDLKTSTRAGAQNKWAFQVLTYALERQYQQAEIHLMTRTKTPAWYRYRVPVTPESLRWMMGTFTFYAKQIEDALRSGNGETLPCRPDYYCGWCADQECLMKKGGVII